jgi:hypothetical protein
MQSFRQIFDDAPEYIAIPKALQHHRLEVLLLPLDEVKPSESQHKRRPPQQFAGRVKELGDVMNTLSAEDWGLSE